VGHFAWAASLLLLAGCVTTGDHAGRTVFDADPSAFRLEPLLSNVGLQRAVFLTHAGDGSGRLFLVEQSGLIHVVQDGDLLPKPFLDLAAGGAHPVVSDRGNEQGLLGLAFHPEYADNGRFFVTYTAVGGDLTIAEYRNPQPADNEADPGSGRVLLVQEHSQYPNHNGGMTAFGPDGFLYIGFGDGGSAGDPSNNAQDPDTLLGKILRIDVDGPCVDASITPLPYCSPDGNPFKGTAGRDEIWDIGLRNPWRFSFDRATGDLWIGDVGQEAWEEVDRESPGQGGRNYGWSRYEGTHTYSAGRQAPGAVEPLLQYSHDEGGGSHCAVTGGYVYRGTAVPALHGTYVFGDYCSGFLWTFRDGRMALVEDTPLGISSFGEDEDGELYVLDLGGDVLKVVAA
jgi:glucose/arabinose dehydrogenase